MSFFGDLFGGIFGAPKKTKLESDSGGTTSRFNSPQANAAIRRKNSEAISKRNAEITTATRNAAANNAATQPQASADVVPAAPAPEPLPEFAPPPGIGGTSVPGLHNNDFRTPVPLGQVSPFGFGFGQTQPQGFGQPAPQQDFMQMLMQILQQQQANRPPPPTEFTPNNPDASQLGAISGGNFGSGVPISGTDPALLMTLFGAGQPGGFQGGFL